MLALHDLSEAPDDVRIFIGQVNPLANVSRQIVKLDPRVTLMEVAPHAFPIARADGLLPAVAAEVPEEKFMFLLPPDSGERRQQTNAVDVGRRFHAGHFGERRHQVIKDSGKFADHAGFDPPGPARDEWHADAAFVYAALECPEFSGRAEEDVIRSTQAPRLEFEIPGHLAE